MAATLARTFDHSVGNPAIAVPHVSLAQLEAPGSQHFTMAQALTDQTVSV
ncbi:hypothetical protein [Nocardia huaxiensis]|nr:hypothetical protein [Nocardia huaxiensis]